MHTTFLLSVVIAFLSLSAIVARPPPPSQQEHQAASNQYRGKAKQHENDAQPLLQSSHWATTLGEGNIASAIASVNRNLANEHQDHAESSRARQGYHHGEALKRSAQQYEKNAQPFLHDSHWATTMGQGYIGSAIASVNQNLADEYQSHAERSKAQLKQHEEALKKTTHNQPK